MASFSATIVPKSEQTSENTVDLTADTLTHDELSPIPEEEPPTPTNPPDQDVAVEKEVKQEPPDSAIPVHRQPACPVFPANFADACVGDSSPAAPIGYVMLQGMLAAFTIGSLTGALLAYAFSSRSIEIVEQG